MQKIFKKMVDMGCKAAAVETSSIGLREFRTAGMTFEVERIYKFSEDHIGDCRAQDMEEYLQ